MIEEKVIFSVILVTLIGLFSTLDYLIYQRGACINLLHDRPAAEILAVCKS